MIEVSELRRIPLFAHLSEEQLACLPFVEQGVEVRVQPGEPLVSEGEPAEFYVLLEGELQVTKKMDGQEMLVVTHRPGIFFGEVALLLGTPFIASAHATSEARLYRIDAPAFWQMLASCPTIAQEIMRTMAQRVQNLEALSQGREKLVALGTMAAGLAHELNNPAAASRRAASQLREALLELQAWTCKLHKQSLTAEHREFLTGLQRDAMQRCAASSPPLDPLAQSDREDEWTDWLERRGVPEGWRLAPSLVAARLDVAWAEELAARLPAEALSVALAWTEATLAVASLLSQVEQSTDRISSLVKSVKAYSFMDQAPRQEIDVHEGLESTLTMLGHKMKGMSVTRDYDRSLPRICAYGGELNQVWTNLLDNAADAAGPGGRIVVHTTRENGQVLVEITDDGPGIPPEARSRLFEPFFTTKAIGQGTGLGLVTSHRIVVGRHRGDIRVESKPGETQFQVRLPIENSA